MRLHAFILLICTVMMGLTSAFFFVEARTLFRGHVTQLEAANVTAVSRHVETVVKGQQYLLSLYREGIGQKSALSKAMLLSQGSGQYVEVERELLRAKDGVPTDLMAVVVQGRKSPVGVPTGKKLEFLSQGPVASKEGFLLASFGAELVLVSYSPVRLYGDEVGTLLLGSSLGRVLSQAVKEVLGTSVAVSIAPTGSSSLSIRLPLIEGARGFVYVTVQAAPSAQLGQMTAARVVAVGMGCLLLVATLIYLVLYFGFLRSFRRNLAGIRRVASELDRGVVAEFEPGRSFFRETRDLSEAVSKFSDGLKHFQSRVQEKTRTELLGQVAAQVAHDLNGVITSMEFSLEVETNSPMTSEKKQTIKTLLSRMRGITSTVVEKLRRREGGLEVEELDRLSEEDSSAEVLSLAVDAVIAEKSVSYSSRPYVRIRSSEDSKSLVCARVQPNEFKRVLSNLLDNAVDAVGEAGDVTVVTTVEGLWARVLVVDTGRGISSEVLGQLGERGFSHGKASGSGLGLWHCIATVEAWGGEVEISSSPDVGTTVLLRIPAAPFPHWLAEQITVPRSRRVCVVDDDGQIGALWKAQFASAGVSVELRQFTEAEEFLRGLAPGGLLNRDWLFIIDYELEGQRWNGLELIAELGPGVSALLVTSHHEDRRVREGCVRAGVKLLPKLLIPRTDIALDSLVNHAGEARR